MLLNTDNWLHVLRGGETRCVFSHLMTIPEGINLQIADHSNEAEGPNTQCFAIVSTGAYISLHDQTYEEMGCWLPEEGAQGAAGSVDLDAKLDQRANSIGQLPNLNRSGQ